MNRLGIVVMYDTEGIVYEYLVYYLKNLKSVCDKLILVVNGIITEDGVSACDKIVDDIYVRRNENFDIGAYIDTIYNYISIKECIQYDEVVLANDTLFGPFTDFYEIFKEMENNDCDVWGLNINPLLYAEHIQSFFYCFRNDSIRDALEYWTKISLPNGFTKSMYIGAYELGVSNYLVLNGRKIDAYAKKNGFNPFNTPQMLLKFCQFPFLKKSVNSCTLDRKIIECNYLECVEYIEENSDYPVRYITDYLKIKYDIDIFDKWDKLGYECNYDVRNRYEEFIQKFKHIYLYGIGEYGQMFYGMLGEKCVKGFIVSSHDHVNEIYNKRVYCIDEIGLECPILVTMGEKYSKEINLILSKYKNVCYIW